MGDNKIEKKDKERNPPQVKLTEPPLQMAD